MRVVPFCSTDQLLGTMIPITADLLNNARNRPYLRDAGQHAIRQLKGIMIHEVMRPDPAHALRNFYNNGAEQQSTHYIVDDKGVLQCIPDNERAFHMHAQSPPAELRPVVGLSNVEPDYFLLGLDLCVYPDADWNKLQRYAADLTAYLLRKYRLSTRFVFRQPPGQLHRDSLTHEDAWSRFLAAVEESMQHIPEGLAARARIHGGQAPVRRGPGLDFPVAEMLPEGALVAVFEHDEHWRRIGRHLWVASDHLRPEKTELMHMVREPAGASVRSGPGMHFPVVDALPCRSMLDALRHENQWVAVGEQRWVHASMLTAVYISRGEVSGTAVLNVRSGPDTTYHIVRQLPHGAPVDIIEEHGSWFRIADDEWVYGLFVSRL